MKTIRLLPLALGGLAALALSACTATPAAKHPVALHTGTLPDRAYDADKQDWVFPS